MIERNGYVYGLFEVDTVFGNPVRDYLIDLYHDTEMFQNFSEKLYKTLDESDVCKTTLFLKPNEIDINFSNFDIVTDKDNKTEFMFASKNCGFIVPDDSMHEYINISGDLNLHGISGITIEFNLHKDKCEKMAEFLTDDLIHKNGFGYKLLERNGLKFSNMREFLEKYSKKEKVTGIKLEGWVENKPLNLGVIDAKNDEESFQNRVCLMSPDCSESVLKIEDKYGKNFKCSNLAEVISAVEYINSHASECIVENGLYAKEPFVIMETVQKDGNSDRYSATMYPTDVNGLFVAMNSPSNINDGNTLFVCRIDGKIMAEIANNGQYKPKIIEKTKFEKYSDKIAYSGDIVSKTIAIEKKIVNLTPEDNQKNNVLNR